jgi:hypothetical protein
MKISSTIHRILTAFALTAAIVFSLVTIGCGASSVIKNLQAVVSGANDVLRTMSATDPSFAKAKKFAEDAQALLDAYTAAQTTGECMNVATVAGHLVTAFQSVILPILSINPLLAAAVAGIDVALRIVAANFHTCIVKAATAISVTTSKASKTRSKTSNLMSTTDQVLVDYLASPKVAN